MSVIETHLRKLQLRASLSPEEQDAIRALIGEVRRVPPHTTLVREGEPISQSIMCLDGWLGRTKDNPNGERQILELHVAGDFADLHGYTLKALDHDLVALSSVKVGFVPHERLEKLFARYPRLTKAYWLMTNIDAAIQREWTYSMGRRDARSRIAHLFCELFERLRVADRIYGNSYDLPLTQAQLSECVGLTPVHINRTLQGMRADGIIQLESRRLTILDHQRLATIADFDPAYLYLARRL